MKNLATTLAALSIAAPALAQTEAPFTRLSLAGEHSRLDNGNADWREAMVQASRHWSQRQVALVELAQTRRFGLEDTRVAASYTHPLAPTLAATVQASASPTHRVLARHAAGVVLQYEFQPAWLVHTGLAHTRYNDGEVTQATLMLERYFGDFSASLAWRPAHALGARTDSFELRGSYYYGQGSSVGVIAATGREATQLGAGAIALAQVDALALVGRHAIGGPWALTYALSRTRQGSFYTRTSASLGVQYTF